VDLHVEEYATGTGNQEAYKAYLRLMSNFIDN